MDQSITERRGYTGLAKETATNLVSGQRRLALPDLSHPATGMLQIQGFVRFRTHV